MARARDTKTARLAELARVERETHAARDEESARSAEAARMEREAQAIRDAETVARISREFEAEELAATMRAANAKRARGVIGAWRL